MRKPAAAGLVTVTLTATAATPEDGTPPTPATRTAMVPFALTGALTPAAPIPMRVSKTLAGATTPKPPADDGARA